VTDQQIFVSGTWRPDRAAPYAAAAMLIGRRIAEVGLSLGCGPGTGISRHVIDGFRSVPARRGVVRYHLPRAELMEAVGELVEPGADEIVQTDLDYPMRNTLQVQRSCGLIAVTGGDGTLEEILPALIDYGLPVAVLRGSGPAALAVDRLVDIFPEWEANLLLADDPEALVKFVLAKVDSRTAK
jgi:predicted Rossmann-fold nucleotide-binding protein